MSVKNKLLAMFLLFTFSVSTNATAESKLLGGEFKAAIVAYESFKIYMDKENRGTSDLESHFKNIENYSIKIVEKLDSYLIVFIPKPIKGLKVFGGGAEYLINNKSYQIINIKYYE